MLREYIIRGCVCYLSEETIQAFEEEQRAIEDEHTAWEQMHNAYLTWCKSKDPMDWDIYSDLHKDWCGCRPRH